MANHSLTDHNELMQVIASFVKVDLGGALRFPQGDFLVYSARVNSTVHFWILPPRLA
jgi:hypothetical protein